MNDKLKVALARKMQLQKKQAHVIKSGKFAGDGWQFNDKNELTKLGFNDKNHRPRMREYNSLKGMR
jgi:hypothetical protein